MPLFQLSSRISFPPPEFAEKNGLLALGGDLGRERLLLAYASGIFPWYDEGEPVLWWSPDPRFVLFPKKIHVAKSLAKFMKKDPFHLSMDRDFPGVISACAGIRRKREKGTWILPEMIDAYEDLHEAGYAHSLEVWDESGNLCGGLYGVSLGKAFFGESMFSRLPNASRVALVALARQLDLWQFDFIDCQMKTEHLASMGATGIRRSDFLEGLEKSLVYPTKTGPWSLDFSHPSRFLHP
ncbi:leucyl/phenylalanyl-tRNA--protein transferase [Desulfococcaceae bacterium OttesenSCG-928-F15]|nr:leucyl/phenylalanyl-tRNA--protein transferase [Desulfococcaceae bacterium OttesenSCG-928-F15]